MIHLVWELYDGKTHREECAEILAQAYMFNNPFVKPLNLTKKDMIQDFLKQLDDKVFQWVFIYFEKNLYYQGLKEIVGVACTSAILDIQNQKEEINYDQVPDPSLVRTYMRFKTLEPFWKQEKKVNLQEYFYSGNFGIKPKYMGKGMASYQICFECAQYMKSLGFKYAVGNAINSIAKRVLRKLADSEFTINLEKMQVLSDQSFPFKDKDLNQVLFISHVDTIIRSSSQIGSRRSPKLNNYLFCKHLDQWNAKQRIPSGIYFIKSLFGITANMIFYSAQLTFWSDVQLFLQMFHLVWELYDGQTHKDECSELLSTAYSYNNPFMAPLKLNKQDMKQDFLLQLDSKIFKWIFIFFDGELYHQGIKEIVGVTCAGEMLDFQTPHELEQTQNFDTVPTPQLVRTYMRYKSLKPFWEKMPNIQKNEYIYVGNTAISPKYMGRGFISYYMISELLSYLKYQGYKYAVSNAINQIAKRFIARIAHVLQEKVSLEEMKVTSDKSQPFKNTGLTQVLFVGEIQDAINHCNQITNKRLPKL